MVKAKINRPKVFYGLIVVVIFILIVSITPGGIALYHQIRGGSLLQQVTDRLPDAPQNTFTCSTRDLGEHELVLALQKGIQHLQIASGIVDFQGRASFLLARAYCVIGDPAKAIASYKQSIARRPGDPLRQLELGMVYDHLAWRSGADPALDHYEGLLAWVNPTASGTQAHIREAVSAWQKAQVTAYQCSEAGDDLAAVQEYDQALKWYVRALWLKPKSPYYWRKIGAVYQKMGNPQDAVSAYWQAWEIDPEHSASTLASALAVSGDMDEMESILHQALRDYPSSSSRMEWLQALGESYFKRGQWDEAKEIYLIAVKEYPDHSDFFISLGWADYERDGDFAYAQMQFERAIALNPDGAAGYAAMGELLGREKRYPEADRWYVSAILKNPEQEYYYLLRANNSRFAGELQTAIDLYLLTIEKFPQYAAAYYNLAQVYKSNDQPSEAMAAIEQAIQVNTSPDVGYYLRAAQIYLWAGEMQKALEAFESVLQIDPHNQEAIAGIERLR